VGEVFADGGAVGIGEVAAKHGEEQTEDPRADRRPEEQTEDPKAFFVTFLSGQSEAASGVLPMAASPQIMVKD